MEILSVKNLSFRYNKAPGYTLKNINMTVNQGDFILLIGESGSSKTTLLKMLKKELSPFGERKGDIFFKGNKIDELSLRDSASSIGFIMQDPDAQIVTDRVYSELAFGLENLGEKRETIRAKVSEFASYFGLSDKFSSRADTLSGGEKQLLNLAAVMTMNPELLILDEPTSMLDPISAIDFISCLKRINEDIGTSVIIAEHHLSEIFQLADKVLYIENGEIKESGAPRDICPRLRDKKIEFTLPAPVRLFNRLNGEGGIPLSVREGKNFIQARKNFIVNNSTKEINSKPLLSAKDIWFRYDRRSEDIIKGLNLTVNDGEIYALVGANGSGKSTIVNIISGVLRAYRGRVKSGAKLAFLPQNPRDLFVKDKLEDDFKSVNNSYKELCDKFGISHLMNRHPYDLSGGEIQRAAIIKILQSVPEIILLDEPTKGLDSFAKKELGGFLRSIGVTILLVTHDLEFAALYSDRCGLLFDGIITSENYTREFFLGNSFYTTSLAKMTKGTANPAVSVEDIVCVESGKSKIES